MISSAKPLIHQRKRERVYGNQQAQREKPKHC
jgi:hypothetical protein